LVQVPPLRPGGTFSFAGGSRSLAGVQAQILPAAGLALWNRTRSLTYAGFDDQLHIRRSLVKLWGQRGTLHVYASDEWPLLIGAAVGRHSWWERQIVRAGTDPDDYQATLDHVAELLRQRGTMNRSDLRASGLDLDEACFNPWGGIFADLVRRGVACHAGQAGNEKLFAHREYWLPGLEPAARRRGKHRTGAALPARLRPGHPARPDVVARRNGRQCPALHRRDGR